MTNAGAFIGPQHTMNNIVCKKNLHNSEEFHAATQEKKNSNESLEWSVVETEEKNSIDSLDWINNGDRKSSMDSLDWSNIAENSSGKWSTEHALSCDSGVAVCHSTEELETSSYSSNVLLDKSRESIFKSSHDTASLDDSNKECNLKFLNKSVDCLNVNKSLDSFHLSNKTNKENIKDSFKSIDKLSNIENKKSVSKRKSFIKCTKKLFIPLSTLERKSKKKGKRMSLDTDVPNSNSLIASPANIELETRKVNPTETISEANILDDSATSFIGVKPKKYRKRAPESSKLSRHDIQSRCQESYQSPLFRSGGSFCYDAAYEKSDRSSEDAMYDTRHRSSEDIVYDPKHRCRTDSVADNVCLCTPVTPRSRHSVFSSSTPNSLQVRDESISSSNEFLLGDSRRFSRNEYEEIGSSRFSSDKNSQASGADDVFLCCGNEESNVFSLLNSDNVEPIPYSDLKSKSVFYDKPSPSKNPILNEPPKDVVNNPRSHFSIFNSFNESSFVDTNHSESSIVPNINKSYDKLLKFLLVGDSDVGKLEMLEGLHNGADDSPYCVDTAHKSTVILLDGKRVKLQLWDTGGQGRFRTITRTYSRGAHGVLLVYDVTNKWSFENLDRWIKEIEEVGCFYSAQHFEKTDVLQKSVYLNVY